MSCNIKDLEYSINSDISAIKKYDKDIKNTYIFIARRLYELKESMYIEQCNFKGYKNIYDLALNEFGYEASKVRYLIAIYLKFFNQYEEKTSNSTTIKGKITTYQDFSISQLRYMYEMTDEQLKKCSPDMTVKEIKDIKLKSGTRVPPSIVDNSTLLKNETPGQNVITGIFSEKSDEEIKEKQKTIIVSSLPHQADAETKIILDVQDSKQNNSFETKSDIDYETLYLIEEQKKDKILKEMEILKKKILNLEGINNQMSEKFNECSDMIQYIYNKLHELNIKSNQKLIDEIYLFNSEGKLPEKLNFMKNVI